jgi:hypothetical protein
MRTQSLPTLLARLILLPGFALGAQLVGKVVRIVDGDTLVLLDSSKTQTMGVVSALTLKWSGRRNPRLLPNYQATWPPNSALAGQVAA